MTSTCSAGSDPQTALDPIQMRITFADLCLLDHEKHAHKLDWFSSQKDQKRFDFGSPSGV